MNLLFNKSLISPKDTREMGSIPKADRFNARALTWQQLGYEAGIDYLGRRTNVAWVLWITIGAYIACTKGWCHEKDPGQKSERFVRFGRKDTSRKRIDVPFVSAMNLTTASDHKGFYVGKREPSRDIFLVRVKVSLFECLSIW